MVRPQQGCTLRLHTAAVRCTTRHGTLDYGTHVEGAVEVEPRALRVGVEDAEAVDRPHVLRVTELSAVAGLHLRVAWMTWDGGGGMEHHPA